MGPGTLPSKVHTSHLTCQKKKRELMPYATDISTQSRALSGVVCLCGVGVAARPRWSEGHRRFAGDGPAKQGEDEH